tara:strand:+ start:5560 stop:5694 length:135 start_codon:yes stop_codon:yes gene_type:complete
MVRKTEFTNAQLSELKEQLAVSIAKACLKAELEEDPDALLWMGK